MATDNLGSIDTLLALDLFVRRADADDPAAQILDRAMHEMERLRIRVASLTDQLRLAHDELERTQRRLDRCNAALERRRQGRAMTGRAHR